MYRAGAKVVIIRLPDLTENLHFEKADTGRLRSLQYCSKNTNTRHLNGSSPFLRSRISFCFFLRRNCTLFSTIHIQLKENLLCNEFENESRANNLAS